MPQKEKEETKMRTGKKPPSDRRMNLIAADEKVTILFRDCATIRVSESYLRPVSRFRGPRPSQ